MSRYTIGERYFFKCVFFVCLFFNVYFLKFIMQIQTVNSKFIQMYPIKRVPLLPIVLLILGISVTFILS